MGQRLLLFISIILLFAFNANADADAEANLPALPTDTAVKVVNQQETEEISLWQKVLNFFGFGDGEESDKKTAEKLESNKDQSYEASDHSNNNLIQNIEKNQNIEANMSGADETASQFLDNTGASAAENNSDNTSKNLDRKFDFDNDSDTEALSIPKGFEDDGPIKLPELPKEITDELASGSSDKKYSKEEMQNLKDNTANSADKMIPKIPESDDKNNSGISKKMDQMVEEGVNDLKLPDGFDDIKSENTQIPAISKTEISKNTKSEQKPEEPLKDEDKDIKTDNFSMPRLPILPGDADTLKDTSSDSIKETESPITTPSASDDESSDAKKSDTRNMLDSKNDIKLPESDDAGKSEGAVEVKSSESKNESEADKVSDMVLPTPDYASSQNEEPKKQESSIEKLTRVFSRKKSNEIELPKITEEDFNLNEDGSSVRRSSVELDSTQLQFVNNEAQVLILPNDDVVLGELTESARINDMDLHSYIKKFWENYNRIKREPQREVIDRFIEEYDENFNQ